MVIDEGSFVPLTEQIRRGISDQVIGRSLSAGDRLPTVRQLARDLDIAPGTVARAYQALEVDGVVITRGRHGTFIADRVPRVIPADDAARDAARRYLAETLRLGLTPQAAVNLVGDLAAKPFVPAADESRRRATSPSATTHRR